MSYLHLQKTWPLVFSVAAHALVVSWAVSAYTPPKPENPHIEPIVVRLIELVPSPQQIALVPKPKIAKLSKAAESVKPTIIESPIPVQLYPVITATPEVLESAKKIDEYTPPNFTAEYLHNPTPEYPPMSKRKGEQGRVLLHVTISEAGAVVAINISQSSGYTRLDQSALVAVRAWRFVPAKFNNHPTIGEVTVPVRFTLES